jgi:hypothetical protein
MNILSEKPEIFCNELDTWVQKIISQKGDESFFTLYIILIDLIRSNFLNFEILNDLENQLKERKTQLNRTAQEICEKEWRFLWQLHSEWKFRRRLVEIKRLVANSSASTQPFIFQIVCLLKDLKSDSKICNFLEKISLIFSRSKPTKNFSRFPSLKTRVSKKHEVACMKNIRPLKQKGQKKIQLNKKRLERLYENSIEMDDLLLQLFVPGNTYIEQHQMLHHLAENHPIFLWERIKFLISCFQPDKTFLQIPNKQSRPTSRYQKWHAAIGKTEYQISSAAKMEFEARNSPFLGPSKLNIEHQIHRKDFERHLHVIVNYIKKLILPVHALHSLYQEKRVEINLNHNITVNNNLHYKEEQNIIVQKENIELTVGNPNELAVIIHSKTFWTNHPCANHDEVYADYFQRHPKKSRLLKDRWCEIVRDRHLDPRPKSEKKRGKDKAPRQKELY